MAKIDVFSGFLGAGKTTLIKKLIKEAYAGEKLVLIENEFGDVGIDGGFMQDAGITVNELNSGCICCSLVGDFSKALKMVEETYNPDRIIIEPSGVGKLSDITRAVESAHLKNSAVNSLTVVVDANKCKMYMKNFGEFFNDQIERAACVVFSHADVASEEKLAQAVGLVREHNPRATFVTTAWDKLSGRQILDAMEHNDTLQSELLSLARQEKHEHEHCHHHEHDHEHEGHEHCCHHDHEHHHHHHDADEVFTSWGVETSKKFSKAELEQKLAKLSAAVEYGMVLRAKGIVEGEGGKWLHFDYVPGEIDVREGGAITMGRLCVIGSKLDEDELKELFIG